MLSVRQTVDQVSPPLNWMHSELNPSNTTIRPHFPIPHTQGSPRNLDRMLPASVCKCPRSCQNLKVQR